MLDLMRRESLAWPNCAWTSLPSVKAGWCCKEKSNHQSARHSVAVAPPNVRWGQRWFPPREPARRTIGTDATRPRFDQIMSSEPQPFSLSCPFPIQNYPNVLMAHGGGGNLLHQLIGKMVMPAFHNP